MRRLLPLALLLAACAPAVRPQPVQTWEGSARVLLSVQQYRLTFTVDPVSHALSGTLANLSSGDRFEASGTLLPAGDAAELTAQVTPGSAPRLNAGILGFGISGLSLKAEAMLSGQITGELFAGSLRVNGLRYPLTLRRVQ
ncbi:hypothetical protein [Deinococcus humi]|uniref:Late embryogenesis abundant protein LEA-2 subgroup domain-containing protein n=1 Tax=Deinococcus humi TaxID=662880 RepID=A0A7W8JS81_9DEIO|nr:hypothetical protein [Deinococcus humi]MBB5362164.1 hypothetical protein [Deinococcus humi]GGO21770.1 hypothetical protein GCM10008949_08340 [Deinococcus humi]